MAVFMLAFLVNALVPAGFMPGQSADGKARIVICTAQGPVVKTVDPGQAPVSGGHGGKKSHTSCPYAPVVAQGVKGLEPALLPVFFAGAVHKIPQPARTLSRSAALKPWSAQGPPRFS